MEDEIRDLERRLLKAKVRIGEQPYVVVRGRSSGAHAGLLESRDPLVLTNSRRLWQWFGAATLSEVAVDGVNSASCKFGRPVRIEILDPIEIIDTTEKARATIEAAPKWEPGR